MCSAEIDSSVNVLVDSDGKPTSHWIELYREICANIRTTDEISFKLLGLVPVFAGVAASGLTLLEKTGTQDYATPVVVLALSGIGFTFTLGFFLWEWRNIKKCKWLIERAKDLEQIALGNFKGKLMQIQYVGWGNRPVQAKPNSSFERAQSNQKFEWGKTQSELVIYSAALLAWCVPAVVAITTLCES